MTMGTSLPRRIDRHSSKPSMPGSMMSISTTSACSRPKASIASSPLAVSSTVQPSSSRAIFTAVRMRSSSSTVKIRVPTTESVPYPAGSARAGVTCAADGQRGEALGGAARRVDHPRRDPLPGAGGPLGDHAGSGGCRPGDPRTRRRASSPSRRCRPAAACSTWAAGPGRPRWPWCRRPARWWASTRRRRCSTPSPPAARPGGVPYQAVLGEWPAAAALGRTPADVVVCHHVAYNVRDLRGLRGRAHRAGPVAGRGGAGRGPSVGGAGAAVAVLLEARPAARADGGRLPGRAHRGRHRAPGRARHRGGSTCASNADAVDVARRRLCLPAERRAEVATALDVLPKVPTDVWTFAWPGDA